MQKNYLKTLALFIAICTTANAQAQTISGNNQTSIEQERKNFEELLKKHPYATTPHLNKRQLKAIPKKDRPDLAVQQNFLMTLDPALGYVPRERASIAYQITQQMLAMKSPIPGVTWAERGPNNVGGRTRALMFDPNDVSNKKVWAGGVAGGLWFNNDITAAASSWQKVDDFWANIAITSIAFDPANQQVFYVGTGEGVFNVDAVRGDGIWKTSNGGTTWTQLASTIPGSVPSDFDFAFVNDIVVTSSGTVFAATCGDYINTGGIMRSADGGTTWTKVLAPRFQGTLAGTFYDRATDIEIAANGDLYASFGAYSDGHVFRSTDNGNTWTDISPNTNGERIEIAIAPSASSSTATTVIYAIADGGNGDNDIEWFKKSTNGGNTWTDIAIPRILDNGSTHFTRHQAFYDLILTVNPNDPNNVIAGGIDLHKTTDGGSTWTGLSHWYGGFGKPNVHADQHNITYRPGSNNEVIFGNDGGVYYSANAGNSMTPSFTMMNNNYNITQFYACAAKNENASPYFLAGAQDNGTQLFTTGGINATTEATGGDGAFCHIDQDNPLLQLTSYTYNTIYRSSDGGNTFPTMIDDQTRGKFINPSDYDNAANILYACGGADTLIRYSGINGTVAKTFIKISDLNGTRISHVRANANSSNRIFIGSDGGRVLRVDDANGSPTITRIDNGSTPITSVGTVSAIDVGLSDNTIIVTYSNYGVKSVWLTTDGGSTWTSKDETGHGLPDMPIRWALFNPNNTSQVLLATEIGVWSTNDIYAANPDWQPTTANLANVRCDMLQYRTADKLVVVATHGRGLYTTDIFASATAEFSANQLLTYAGNTIQFTDASLQATSWSWDFGDGNTSTLQNPIHNYANGGKYTVILTINGGQSSKTKTNYIHILPAKTPPYLVTNGGDFETNPEDFGSQTLNGGLNLWERGVPSNALTTINSGTKVWKTDMDADITKGTYRCALLTPNYNMSASGTYSLRFRKSMEVKYGNAPFAVQLQYSLDKGATWMRMGTENDPNGTNWYERGPSATVQINTDIFADKTGWAENSTNTLTGYNISFLAGNADVAFRFLLSVQDGYSQAGYDVDGFMIDDFEIDYINCNNIALPLTQSFENAVFPPACWAAFRGANGLGTTKDWVRNDTLAKTGSACASVKFENVTGGTAQDWLVTPKLTLATGKNTLSFWQRQAFTPAYGTNYFIKISTTSQTDPTAFTNLTTYGESAFSTTFTQKTIDLSAYNGQSVYVAFVMEQDDGDSWFIDDINITGAVINGINVPEMTNCDDSVKKFMEKHNVKGLSLTLAKAGKIVFSKGYGYNDLNHSAESQTYNLCRIGSMSKSITAIAIMKLIENGQLNLSDKAFGVNGILNSAYYSNANVTDNRIYDITVQHLLEHTAGFNGDVNCTSNPTSPYWWNNNNCDPWVVPLHVTQTLGEPNPITRKALVKFMTQKDLNFTPGTSYKYSNMGFSILAEIIEAKTGMTYENYIKTNILDAIGICDAKVGKSFLSEKQEREFEYHPNGGGGPFPSFLGDGTNAPHFIYGGRSQESMDAFGGWIASTPDLIKILWAVDGKTSKPDILSSGTVNTMFTPSTVNSNYAKGWVVWNGSAGGFNHNGDQDGQSSSFRLDFNGEYAYAVVINMMGPLGAGDTAGFRTDWNKLPWDCFNSTTTFPTHDLGLSPTQNSANLTFSNVGQNSVTVNWTNGNGAKRLVAVHKDTTVNAFPVDGKNYTANTIYGQGTDLENSNFVVYDGASNSVTVTNLLPNTKYYFRVFDYNQNTNTGNNALYKVCDCAIQPVVTAGPPPVVAFTGTPTTIASGGSVTFTDQSINSPNAWQWTFDGGTPATSTQKNPAGIVYNNPGNFAVKLVASNANGSDSLTKVNYIIVNATVVTTNITNVSCNGGSNGAVELVVSGSSANSSFTYLWSNGATTQNLTNVTANTYTVTITPVSGGSAITKIAAVQQPAAVAVTVSKLTHISCNGVNDGAIEITVLGGTSPYAYLWSNNTNAQNIAGLSTGTYTVTVTDSKNCTATATATLNQPAALLISVVAQTGAICGTNNGSIDISVTGGTTAYSYSWSNGANTQDVAGLSGGNYTVTVTDAKGCIATKTISVSQSSSLTASVASVTNVSCNGGSNGAVSITVSGGTTPYTYTWSNNATSQNISNLTAGNYNVTVTDASGCAFNLTASVTEPGLVSASVASKTDVSCNGGSNGAINISVNGGTSPYTYSWSNGVSAKNVSGLTAGNYTVTVTATGGCTATASATISQPQPIGVTLKTAVNVSCFGGNNGSVQILVSGGNSPYSFSWSNGATTKDIANLTAGTYKVTVTDAAGCMNNSFTHIVGQPSLFTVSVTSQTNVSCFGGSNGVITINTTGGVTPYAYEWDNKLTGQNQTGLFAGTYHVTVTDTNGCSSTANATITEPPALTVLVNVIDSTNTGITNVTCYGGTNGAVSVITSGGSTPYSYLWSNGAITQNLSNIPAGNYTITVTDSKACTAVITDANNSAVNVSVAQPAQTVISSSATHVSCNGGNNGSIDITVTGGGSPYAFNWSTNATTEDISGLLKGDYTVSVTATGGCVTTKTTTVNQPPLLAVSLVSVTDNTGCGSNNGAVSINVQGGKTPYSYLWPSGVTTKDLTNVGAGTYIVTVTDVNSCTKTLQATVNQPGALAVTSTVVNVNCTGGNNGSIDLSVSGGTTPYSFLWSTNDTIEDISGLVAGNYTATITDVASCVFVYSKGITQPNPAAVSVVNQTNVSCNGGNNGALSVNASGGTAPFTYAWSNGGTQSQISNLTSQTYTVTATDSKGCTSVNSATISQPSALSGQTNTVNVSCNGGGNGSVIASATGGQTPYTYLWSNGATTASITGLAAGNYAVTITDAVSCVTSANGAVSQPPALSVVIDSVLNTSCSSNTGGAIYISVTGGTATYSYNWSNNSSSEDLTNSSSGNYTVTVTDAKGCSVTNNASIIQPGAPAVSVSNKKNPSCNGGSNGSIDISVTGGAAPYAYLWSNNATTKNIGGLSDGTYSVTVTGNNGCSSVLSGIATLAPPALAVNVTGKTNVLCNGANTGSLQVASSGAVSPYSYLWSNGAISSQISNLTSQTYTVTITDNNGCIATLTDTITQPLALSATVTNQTNTTCGNNNGSVSVAASGGVTPYSYLWSNGATSDSASGLQAGNYTVTVTDNNGCKSIAMATITQPGNLAATVVPNNVSCNGSANGSIDLTASGGTAPYTFKWSNNATTEDVSNLPAGAYAVTITDGAGCKYVTNVPISEPQVLLANAGTVNHVSCSGGNNGSASLNVSGGTLPYSYLWSTGSADSALSAVGAGTYAVTITDVNGCTKATNVTINEPPVFSAGILNQTNPSCFGSADGSITLSVSGGNTPYSYLWSNGAVSASLSALAAGAYSVTVTSAGGCTAVANVTLNQPGAMGISLKTQTNVLCNGGNNGSASLHVNGGISPYSYTWSNGATTSDVSNLTAGNYTITATDSKGCTATLTVTISEPTVLTAAVTGVTNVTCNGGSNGAASLSVTGGISPYSYSWNNGDTTSQVTNLTSQTYSATVTDANGCAKNASVTITQPQPVSVNISQTNPSCNAGSNGSVIASASGGTSPYSYLWSNSGTQSSANNLLAGTYSVTVTSTAGCTGTSSATLTAPSAISITIDSTQITTCGSNNGAAFISVSGGASPYTYNWSNGSADSTLSAVSAGNYTVTVTDNAACVSTAAAAITQNSTLTVSVGAKTDASCNGGNDGSITITVADGNTPYTYAWSNASTTQNVSGLTAGSYSVTVTDVGNCQFSLTTSISEPEALGAVISVQSSISCYSSSDGILLASAIGGTSPFTYNWSTGGADSALNAASAGNYSVTVTDSKGCEATGNTYLSDPQIFAANISGKINANCFNANNGSMSATITGGTAPFTYSWSNSATTQNISSLAPATYTVTVTDDGGCTATATDSVTEPSDMVTSAAITDVTTNGGNDGAINLTVSGGVSPYAFNWSNNTNTEDVSSLVSGTYTVTVTNANGCSKTSSSAVNQPTGATYCSGTTTLTAASDTFSDGSGAADYGNNANCYWLIQPAGASSVTLTFSSFATQTNSDWVKIYDGADTNAISFGSYSGTTLPSVLTSTGGSMLVWFGTNASVTDAGWSASYTSTVPTSFCNGTTNLTAASGSFDDGSAGNDYAENSNCNWLLQPSGAVSVTLTFPAFETEGGYDFVNVYDGNSAGAPLLGSFTGSNIPSSITSSGGEMFVAFTSDASVNAAGWNADYTSSTTSVTSCSGSTTLTDMTGSFSDGSNAGNYGSNSDCSWLIQPAGANNITLSFTSFNTQSANDLVYVYDGADTSAALLGSFSGTTNPGTIVSSGGSMFMWFTSDASINAAGWSAYYSGDTATAGVQCSGLTVLTANTGSFSDGSGAAEYSENSNCKWLIQPAGATYITLNFSEFATESGYDYVYVYEGIDSTGTLLGSFTGSSLPGSVTAVGASVFVQFISDYTVNSGGWTASYEGFTGTPSYCQTGNILTAEWANFSDGSGTNNYLDNSACSWLIQPPGATTVTLWFDTFNTENGYDYIVVYDGTDNTADTLLLWTGDSLPPTIASTGGAMYVEFYSDSSNTAPGWYAEYIATTGAASPYCSGTTDLTAVADTFSDGSGNDAYANNSDCKWLIHPAGANMITLNFTNFSIESGYDYVYVYQGSDTSGTLVGSFTGSALPSSVTVSDTAMFVWFVADGFINDAGWSASYTSSTSTLFCNGTITLTDSAATFSDGSGNNNYMDNADCSWLIQPVGASSITLNFTEFATENGYDYVRVYEGTDAGGILLGEFTGSDLPASITMNSSSMFVNFTSNFLNNPAGWTANYSAQFAVADYCSGTTTLTTDSGTFSDGSTTNNYRENTNCSWLIQPASAVAIVLGFDAFNTESGYDFVRVYKGADATAPMVAEFSGSTIPDSITVVNSEIFVQFTSDGSVNYDGWDAWYHLSTDTTIVTVGCSGTTSLTLPADTFTDGSGNSNYFDNSDCKWLIQPAGANYITLSFSAFNTESGYDFVKVYDGATTSDPLLGSFSGSAIPSAVSSTGGVMLVHFTSDGVVNDLGWTAYYDTTNSGTQPTVYCSGTTSLTNASDCFSDGSDTSNYLENSNCQWLIQPVGATSVTLTFSSFSVENNFDYVYVYDGATTSDSLLGMFTGDSLPPSVTSTGGVMLVNFISDNIVNYPGWDACYTSDAVACNMSASATGTNATCNGVCDGSATIDVTGGTAPYSYVWDNGNGTNLCAGTYTVTVTDFNSCTATASVPIAEPAVLVTTIVGDSATCNGCADGSANLTVSGGTSPYSYNWTGGYITEDITGLLAGIYYVTVTDTSGCSAVVDSVTIYEPDSTISYCSGTVTLTAPSGSFDDGSGTDDYMLNSDCKWLIQPTGALTITLTFSAFNTEAGYDSVTVYDGATTAAPILGSFSGSTVPSPATSTGGSMLVHFTSDNLFNFAGWAASYTITTGIVETGGAVAISIFPNPNSGEFTYSFTTNNTVKFAAKVVNVLGETVWHDAPKDITGKYSKNADIKNLSAGVYFLHISMNDENYVMKIMRE